MSVMWYETIDNWRRREYTVTEEMYGQMGEVLALCISQKRGTQKHRVEEIRFVENFGLEGDAHGGNWHRQVSLLSFEKIEAFRQKGAEVGDGAFGENVVASGIDFRTLPIGIRFTCGEALLELTQIGKECHHGCEIFQKMGDCIMPREGVFARILKGGVVRVGDPIRLLREENTDAVD